jgi:hypothetical protein
MKKTEIIELIKGTFTPDEAREILLQLLNSKINFHNRRNFSSRERFGKPDAYSEQRLEYLMESRKIVLALVSKSTDAEKLLTINSSIEINIE